MRLSLLLFLSTHPGRVRRRLVVDVPPQPRVGALVAVAVVVAAVQVRQGKWDPRTHAHTYIIIIIIIARV